MIFGFTKDTSPDSSSSISMLSEWTDENGKSISLDELPSGEEVCLTADLKSLAYSGKQFCFKSVDTVLEVYADGKLLRHSLTMCYTYETGDFHTWKTNKNVVYYFIFQIRKLIDLSRY